jgi:hypothetical protein
MIYLSSTYEDLKEYRAAAAPAIGYLNHEVSGMEDYIAADERHLEACLKDVGQCKIYVGLFAHRYGFGSTCLVCRRRNTAQTSTVLDRF